MSVTLKHNRCVQLFEDLFSCTCIYDIIMYLNHTTIQMHPSWTLGIEKSYIVLRLLCDCYIHCKHMKRTLLQKVRGTVSRSPDFLVGHSCNKNIMFNRNNVLSVHKVNRCECDFIQYDLVLLIKYSLCFVIHFIQLLCMYV